MIKQLLTISLITASLIAGAQSFSAKYNFAATTTVTGVTDPTPPPTATGVTFGSFTAVGTGSNSSSAGNFSFAGWGTGATTGNDVVSTYTGSIDPAKYYEVAITPQSGFEVTLTDITFTARRSGTGPRQYALRSSMDAFTANLPASIAPTNTALAVVNTDEFFFTADANTNNLIGSTITLGSGFVNFTSAVNFRLFAWNAEGTAGTFRIDSVIFNGSASLITGLGKVTFDLNSNLNIYPTPSHDGVVFIESKNATDVSKIEVLDVLGNVILSSNAKNDSKVKLNLAEMPNGNYFVRVYSGSSVATKKIVIVK